jgi:site-specific DNA recombinase
MNLSAQTPILEPPMKKKIAVIYARVSSQQQKEEETIDSQIETLLNYANENGFDVPVEWIFKDNGYTGTTLDRPGLDNLRDLTREYPIHAILVYSPDRLARKYALQLILDEEFRKLGVQLIYFKGGSEQKTPEDCLLAHFQGIFAEYERAQILDRTRRGKLYKIRQGDVRMLPPPPYGYYKERNTLFYTIKENEAQNVRKIFHLFAKDRLNLRQIALRLQEENILAPKGGQKWEPSTIKGILGNTSYIGTAYFGKTEKYEGNPNRIVRYKKKGKVVKPIKAKRMRPQELWEPLSVPQIICESDFEIAQELLKKNKEFASRNTKEPSLLQGLLVCGLCGRSFYKKRRGNRKNPAYYTCQSHLSKNLAKCGNRSVRVEIIDKIIWDNIVHLLKNPNLIEQEINRRSLENPKKNNHILHKTELEREMKQIERAHNKLLDAYQEGDCLSLEELRRRSKNLKEKESVLKKELESVESLLIGKENYEIFTRTLEVFKNKLDRSYDSMPIKDKQVVARTLIEDIVIYPEEVEIRHSIPVIESANSPLCSVFGC